MVNSVKTPVNPITNRSSDKENHNIMEYLLMRLVLFLSLTLISSYHIKASTLNEGLIIENFFEANP